MRRLLAALALALCGCAVKVPEGIKPVEGFELDRYLGEWYEIARLDHRFERGLSKVTAEYSMRADGGVRVLNRGYSAEKGGWKEAEGRAYFTGDPSVGGLKVSFFGPFYGGYNIIELGRENYAWALVCGPDRSYLWILARTPELAPETLEKLKARAAELGFPVPELIFPG
ncbi:MAG TPA: lipocalin family protein [Elusimicrobiales bacterium]|nr:lipocalin family protein [Elusimicrobiales bacterium]